MYPGIWMLDEQRMIQIVLNLISNAAKFTEKGSIRIIVSWQTTSTACSLKGSDRNQDNCTENDNNQASAVVREEDGATYYGNVQEFPETLEDSPSKKENHHLVTWEVNLI